MLSFQNCGSQFTTLKSGQVKTGISAIDSASTGSVPVRTTPTVPTTPAIPVVPPVPTVPTTPTLPTVPTTPTVPTVPTTPTTDIDVTTPPCKETEYAGFLCLSKNIVSDEGVSYSVVFRWNRISKNSNGTVIWVLGGDGRGRWRTNYKEAIAIEDALDTGDGVRSVEIEFLDAPKVGDSGGYWKNPNGYYSAASGYMAALKFIVQNLKKGSFLNHVGGSNGTMVAAYGLSHFNAGAYLDRVIFHAGPFLPSIADACDTSHFASFYRSAPAQVDLIKSLLSIWGYGREGVDVCATTSVDRLSVLQSGSTYYPKTAVHVVMGQKEVQDGFGNWMLESNFQWFSKIQAAEKTRKVSAAIGHEMEWSSIRAYARLPAPQMMGSAPTLTFSMTSGGPATVNVPLNGTVYGTATNIASDSAMACMSDVTTPAFCDNPHNWTQMPNSDWKFVNGQWKSAFTPAQIGAQAGHTYMGFYVNAKTGQRSQVERFTVLAN